MEFSGENRRHDKMNKVVRDSFNRKVHGLTPYLLSMRVFEKNSDVTITSFKTASNHTLDVFLHCFIDPDNNHVETHSFLGGSTFSPSVNLTKNWDLVPKGYEKRISFLALFQHDDNPNNLIVTVNNNNKVANRLQQSNDTHFIQALCNENGVITMWKVYNVTFVVEDYTSSLSLNIQSSALAGWGIRELNVYIMKCHPTCLTCRNGGESDNCTACTNIDRVKQTVV